MSAGVHYAFLFALEGQAGLLFNRQRVHISPKEKQLTGLSAVNGCNQAGLNGALHIGNAQTLQFLRDQGAGLKLLIGQLRVFMNLAAKLNGVIRPTIHRLKQFLYTIHS